MLTRLLALAAAIAAVFATLCVTTTVAATASPYDSCPVAAHRGDHWTATENSTRAFQTAVADRANYLELDVRTTRSGHFMLMHDVTVDRTTNGTGRIATKTTAQVRALRLNDGQRVPYLSSVLGLAKRNDVGVFLEMKAIPSDAYDRLAVWVRTYGDPQRTIVNSFSGAAVRAFQAEAPTVRTSLDSFTAVEPAVAAAYGSVMIHYPAITDAWLARMNEADIPVYAWTVDSGTWWRKLRGRVDVVITNKVKSYVTYRDANCTS